MLLASPPLADTLCESDSVGAEEARVLVVARWPVGGIRTHLGCNYAAIAAAGYRCTFVLPQDETFPAVRELLREMPGSEFQAVEVQGRRCPLWKTLRPLMRSGKFALVHAHGLTAVAHAALAGLGGDVPLLATLHEPLREAQFRGLVGPCKRWLLGRALARAAAVITVSADSRANLLRYFPNLRRHVGRIHTFPNGIESSRFTDPPLSGDLREELEIDDDTILIGFLGRFMPEKGFPLLVETIARLVKYGSTRPFHIVAFGSSDYRREYARDIEQQGLAGHITLRDFVPDVVPVLRDLDLVVVPSLWEASSLVSMEAMAAGVPVLGSDCPGLREVLRGTPSRMVATAQVAALESGLREALAELWTDEAREFAPVARERFDNRNTARRLTEIYGSISCPLIQAG